MAKWKMLRTKPNALSRMLSKRNRENDRTESPYLDQKGTGEAHKDKQVMSTHIFMCSTESCMMRGMNFHEENNDSRTIYKCEEDDEEDDEDGDDGENDENDENDD